MELVFDKDGCPGITKSPVLYEKIENELIPVLYFRKPKQISQEKFDQIVRTIINRAKK